MERGGEGASGRRGMKRRGEEASGRRYTVQRWYSKTATEQQR
jgi:hypothetical protein